MKIFTYLILVGVIGLFVFNSFEIRKFKKNNAFLNNEVAKLEDQRGKDQGEKFYLSSLTDLSFINGDLNGSKIPSYTLSAGKHINPKELSALFADGKKYLVVRYTEIGCNSCIDSTFHVLNSSKLSKKYKLLVLVDFTNYEYYVKWKKLAEVNDNIFWVKKGDLPFSTDRGSSSYLFVVDEHKYASGFFIPNSLYTQYLKKYFSALETN